MRDLGTSLSRLLVVVALVVVEAASPAMAARGCVSRESVASNGMQADNSSGRPAVSGDGRFVAFESFADNLVPDDTNHRADVFVRDLERGETTRVSVTSAGKEAKTFQTIRAVAISSDGSVVAFSSAASDLVPDDTNGMADVFVHDLATGRTTRVSVASDGSEGNSTSYGVGLSADGRFVAFSSSASNLVPGDVNDVSDVFVHDMATGETSLVSVASDGTRGDLTSGGYQLSMSDDGRFVVFDSSAATLVPKPALPRAGMAAIYVHDRVSGETNRASVASTGAVADDSSFDPVISGNGRFVAFESSATNLDRVPDTDEWMDIFVHDRQTGETQLVSASTGGVRGNWTSYSPVISRDGRFIAFQSDATNLVAGDTNKARDIFWHDVTTGVTTRVSVDADGRESDGWSQAPAITPDGQQVLFLSGATNLVPQDTNRSGDVFLQRCVGYNPASALKFA
jgi:Tol biopolymer transport system component